MSFTSSVFALPQLTLLTVRRRPLCPDCREEKQSFFMGYLWIIPKNKLFLNYSLLLEVDNKGIRKENPIGVYNLPSILCE